MSLYVIPIVQEFYLTTNKIEIPENRIIPTAVRNGKMENGYMFEKSHPYYEINTLYWQGTPAVKGIFIIHFHEILLGFIHSQLTQEKRYIIMDNHNAYGVKLYLQHHKPTNLCIEIFNQEGNEFVLVETLCKVECRILVRKLHHYLHQGAIIEEALCENVECSYSEKSFKLKTPKV